MPLLTPLLVGSAMAHTAYRPPYAVLRFGDYEPLIRNTAARPTIKNYSRWSQNNIPLLDFPDPDVQATYYYRWRLFREHVETRNGLALIDEFLPGAGGHPISCAAGHHFAEGMWLRDASVLDDVSEYWFEQAGDVLYQYTHWIGSSALRRQTLRGDADSAALLLQRLAAAGVARWCQQGAGVIPGIRAQVSGQREQLLVAGRRSGWDGVRCGR
jgi:hypothetical protein